jgi:hypothetical protein
MSALPNNRQQSGSKGRPLSTTAVIRDLIAFIPSLISQRTDSILRVPSWRPQLYRADRNAGYCAARPPGLKLLRLLEILAGKRMPRVQANLEEATS